MRQEPDPAQTRSTGELTVSPTLDDYRQSTNLLHFGQFSFFVQCWRLKLSPSLGAIVSGSLFTHCAVNSDVTALDQPRCILGRDPSTPARFAVNFHSVPDGDPATWTAADLAQQELTLIVPAVVPWIPAAVEVRLKNRRQVTSAA